MPPIDFEGFNPYFADHLELRAIDTVDAGDFLYDQSADAAADAEAEWEHGLAEWLATHDEDGNPIPTTDEEV